MLRPASWLALLSRTFTFELSLTGSPRANVEYNYVGKQSTPTTGLSPASPTALRAAELGLTPWTMAFGGRTLDTPGSAEETTDIRSQLAIGAPSLGQVPGSLRLDAVEDQEG
jgi:hypothetical protein